MDTATVIKELSQKLRDTKGVISVNQYHENPNRYGQDSGQVGWKYDQKGRTNWESYRIGTVNICDGVVFIPDKGYFNPSPLTTDSVWSLILDHYLIR